MDNIFKSIHTFNYNDEIKYTSLPFCGGKKSRKKIKKKHRKTKHIKRKNNTYK